MCSKLAVKNMTCMLMTLGMKWRNGVGVAAHESPRGQADKSMGAAEGFVVFTAKRCCLVVTDARGEETGNGGGGRLLPADAIASWRRIRRHLSQPFSRLSTLCSELLDAAFDVALELRRCGCGSEENNNLRIFWTERPNLGC